MSDTRPRIQSIYQCTWLQPVVGVQRPNWPTLKTGNCWLRGTQYRPCRRSNRNPIFLRLAIGGLRYGKTAKGGLKYGKIGNGIFFLGVFFARWSKINKVDNKTAAAHDYDSTLDSGFTRAWLTHRNAWSWWTLTFKPCWCIPGTRWHICIACTRYELTSWPAFIHWYIPGSQDPRVIS